MFLKGPHGDVIGFHRRHALYMIAVFVFLLIVFFLLLAKQYRLNAYHQNRLLLRSFQEHVSDLDNLLANVTSRVEGLRIQAESDMMEMGPAQDITPPLAFGFLKETEAGDRFHLDDFAAPVTREYIGNLTGEGSLRHRDGGFYREIYMALRLNPQFRVVSRTVRDAAWVYYTSARDFINIYPWVSSKDFRFTRDLFGHEFFTLGTPARNTEKRLFWTEVYLDEYGKGLMTTCAAPVYDRERFLGTVAVDLTVDLFNAKIRGFRAEKGTMFLVNDRDQILAHPRLITSRDRATRTLLQALPEELRPDFDSIVHLSANSMAVFKGYTVLRSGLGNAPWQAYYLEPRPSAWNAFLERIGPGALILMGGLLVLVVIVLSLTQRNFVVPSGRLVSFITALSRGDFSSGYRKVPEIWKPWFDAIEDAFRKNEELTQEIRRQNEELERRVEERTDKLVKSNRQLLFEMEERKQAEKEKQRLQAQLQRAQKMEAIGTLAGGVAHDLNNVLAGLVSYPQLLLMELDPDSPIRESILTIQRSGERAAAIVQDLLTLARRGVAVTEIVNLNDLVSDYLGSAEFRGLLLHHPGVEVRTDLEGSLLNTEGSPVHLSKCLMNLVTNASEAMPQGGTILISTGNRYIDQPVTGYDEVKEGDYVTLSVTDSGTGISREDLERIFEPFYSKKVMGRSGTGLGMAVVWGTVKDHNGYIDIQSEAGRGTSFTLFFPATREAAARETTAVGLDSLMGKGELILIVDDVHEQREIAKRMLERLGYRVEAVSSGEEAVSRMQGLTPDLIVLDMIMDPGMDGLDTYRKILDIRPGQKAIIVSGFSETDRVREAQRLGAGYYVKKPFLIEKLAAAVKKELEG